MNAITCPHCRKRLDECPTTADGFPLAREAFEVGNPAPDSMGHAIYHDKTGTVALCNARRLQEKPGQTPHSDAR